MMRLIAVAVGLLVPAAFLPAQDRSMQMQKVEQVARQLNLTPAQEMKLIPILKTEAPKVEAIRSNASLTRLQKLEQLRALHNQTDPQVKSILTPEQYNTLKEIRRREIQEAAMEKRNQ